MPLPPTPWIRTYDTPELYLKGYGIGLEEAQLQQRAQIANAEIAHRSQQLAVEAARVQMETNTRIEIARQQALAQQHREAIMGEQRKIQLGLQQERLQETQRMNDIKVMQTARRAQAMQQANQRYQELVGGGMEPGKARVQAAMEMGPEMGVSGTEYMATSSALAQMAEAQQRRKETSDIQRTRLDITKEKEKATVPREALPAISQIAKLEAEMVQVTNKKQRQQAQATVDGLKRGVNAAYRRHQKEPIPYPEVEQEGWTPVGESGYSYRIR